jgi:rubrerythrin
MTTCAFKHRYATRAEAKRAMRCTLAKSTGQRRRGANVYRCPICGFFHWGHRTGGRAT